MKKYKVLLPSGETLLATNDVEEAIIVANLLNLRIKVEGEERE